MSRIKQITVIWLLVLVVFCWAANNTPWDGTEWDSDSPDIDQPLGNAYKEIYSLRRGFELRMEYEHSALTVDASAAGGGVHLQGAAVAYHQDAEPATDGDGEHFTTAASAGHLWLDTNESDELNFLNTANGSGSNVWTPVSTEVIATMLASNRVFGGTLGVTGLITANAGVTLGAGDDLTLSATSDITSSGSAFEVSGATGNTGIGGTLAVSGNVTMGGTLNIQTSTAVSGVLDEDAMGSDSAVKLATQQSIKAYIDAIADSAYTGGQDHTFNGGLQIKFGKLTAPGGTEATITFGTSGAAFSNAAIVAFASHNDVSQATDSIVIKTLNTTTLGLLYSNNVNDDIYWIAIGY